MPLGPSLDAVAVTLIGHPFAPIGMGEQMRSHIAAALAARLDVGVFDVYRFAQRLDPAHHALIDALELDAVPPGVRIFHINGDEVERVLEMFTARGNDFDAGYNIIVPAWELPAYPDIWAEQLRRFDEVWALSDFITAGLAKAGVASTPIGQSVEMAPGAFLPRRYFAIRESAFVLLHFFDLSSYATRKNPFAVTALMDRIRADDPFADVQLVLKVKDRDQDAAAWAAEFATDATVRVIVEPLDSLGVRSLLRACDCFVSLHRAEGFGRGLGEAMGLARLALGTAWSGNMDFMTDDNALCVRHTLVPVGRDEYPHWEGQSWAEPDVDHAHALLAPCLRDPARGRAIALRGQADVMRTHSNRAVGVRMLDRVEAIVAETDLANLRAGRQRPKKAKRRA